MKRLNFLLIVLAFAACKEPQTSAPTLALTPCTLVGGVKAQCGELEVFEDRDAKTGRKIGLDIAVVEARSDATKPDPLFVLVGGPGQSATTSGVPMAMVFGRLNRKRDIVLVDVRGTGDSNLLHCEDADPVSLADMFEVKPVDAAELRECLQKLDADPAHYTTPNIVDDLNDVRKALGYRNVNLWGGSYGTRVALEYSRRHPDSTRRIVLDGAAPTDIKLVVHAGRDAQRSLNLMFEQCAASEECRAAFGDIAASFETLRARLVEAPQSVELRHPRTHQLESLQIGPDGLATMVRSILYVPSLVSVLPLALTEAIDGDWAPLITAFLVVADSVTRDMAGGMFLSVVCAEDASRISPEEREQLSDNFLGDLPTAQVLESCEHWPHASLPPSYFEPVRSKQPTLVFSGNEDPVTPPSWGELVADRLPDARHFVIEGMAHGVSHVPCVTKTIEEFFDAEDPAAVEFHCDSSGIPGRFVTRAIGEGP